MFKAGFSRVDVTPHLGSFVAGYFKERYAKGVLDPIYLNALAVTDGTETAAAFAEGGYEARWSFFTPTLESECVSAAAEMLKGCDAE